MNYTINETFEISGYTAVIEADQNLASLITDNFRMEVRDILTNQVEEITKDDLMKWGTSVDTSLDPSLWETQSCINNGGMYINFNGNTLTFKQIIPCLKDNILIGYNSSQVSVVFNDNDHIDFYSKTLPFFKRDLPKSDNYEVEPILPEGSARPDYDFDDYKNNILMNGCKSNFEYNTVGDLYVNNELGHVKKYNKGKVIDTTFNKTPLYYTDVSAFYITEEQVGAIEPYMLDARDHWKSVIWNEITDEETDIPVLPIKFVDGSNDPSAYDATATLEFEGCTSKLKYRVYRQYLSDELFPNNDERYRKNIVKFQMDFNNNGIHRTEIQQLEYVSVTREEGEAFIRVIVRNPNLFDGLEVHPLKDAPINIKLSDGYTITDKVEIPEINGVSFKIPVDIACGYNTNVEIWLSKDIPGFTSDMVKSRTYAFKGPLDFPGLKRKSFERITAEVIGYRKYDNSINIQSIADCQNVYANQSRDAYYNDTLMLKDTEYGIIKIEITNPNAGQDWPSDAELHTPEILIDPSCQFGFLVADDHCTNTKTEAYLFGFIGNLEERTSVDIFLTMDGTGECGGNWILDFHDISYWYLEEPEKLPISVFPCSKNVDTWVYGDYGSEACKYYIAPWKNDGTQTLYDAEEVGHVLKENYRNDNTKIDETSDFGVTYFKVLNPNTNRSTSDQVNLTFTSSNGTYYHFEGTVSDLLGAAGSHELRVGNDVTSRIFIFADGEHSIIDKYISDGELTFDWYDIEPQTIYMTAQINSLESKTSTSVQWTSQKFIPHDWEDLLPFVLFTKSKLDLIGAYIGVKSIYCTALRTSNEAYIECEKVYIDGNSSDLFDGRKLVLNNLNSSTNKHRNWITYKNPTDAELLADIRYSRAPLTASYIYGNGSVWADSNAHDLIVFTDNGTGNFNNNTLVDGSNIVGSNLNTEDSDTVPDLPTYEVLTDGEQEVYVQNTSEQNPYVFGTPGSFGTYKFKKLTVSSAGTQYIKFYPGEYHFGDADLSIECPVGTRIIIEECANESQYVRICCKGRISFANQIMIQNKNTTNKWMTLMIYSDYVDQGGQNVAINFAAGQGSNNDGVLVAPNGTVNLGNGNNYWKGAIWAKNITLQDGVAFLSSNYDTI